jgi:hypothetical protein
MDFMKSWNQQMAGCPHMTKKAWKNALNISFGCWRFRGFLDPNI